MNASQFRDAIKKAAESALAEGDKSDIPISWRFTCKLKAEMRCGLGAHEWELGDLLRQVLGLPEDADEAFQ